MRRPGEVTRIGYACIRAPRTVSEPGLFMHNPGWINGDVL